ncbi:MAG: Membrane protein insertase YidC [Phycisphaerae bacterium]|nr:Membrane protein insertase YidC [Phycisphaerae bacterium]
MDKQNLVRALLVAMLFLLVWNMLSTRMNPPPPGPSTNGVVSTAPTTAPVTSGPAVAGQWSLQGAGEEQLVELGNTTDDPDSPYRLHVTLSSRGAGVVRVRLTDYFASLHSQELYEIIAAVTLADQRPSYAFSTQRLNLDQQENLEMGGQNWRVEQQESAAGQEVIFSLDLFRAGQPAGVLRKRFLLTRQEKKSGHNDLRITLEVENSSAMPFQVIWSEHGPSGMRHEDPREEDRQFSAGLLEAGNITIARKRNKEIKPHQPHDMISSATTGSALSWVGMTNKFFVVIAAAENNTPAAPWLTAVRVVRLRNVEKDYDDGAVELVTRPLDVAPGQKITQTLDCYLGPKAKSVFAKDDTYQARNYVGLVNADYYSCAWTPIVDAMLWLLFTSHTLLKNYGLSIILMVLIVRTILHPLTKKGQVSMMRLTREMSVLQPKMEEIRKKFANDRQKQNEAVMKLYQEHNINPAGQMLTCLPMFLQMPIWAGLWAALNYTVEMRHQPFFWWITDLSAPDSVWQLSFNIPLLSSNHISLLPPLLGIGMWLQQRLMPKPAAAAKQSTKTDDQMAQQRLMMGFMSIFMVFIFYNAPSGLTLYIMASNFFGLFESYLIRKHIEKHDQQHPPQLPGQVPEKPLLKKPKFLEKLEKMADDARKK